MLVDDECYPTTKEIGFIEIPVAEAARIYPKLWTPEVPVRATNQHGSLRDVLYRLLPLTSVERRRMVFLQTASRWTAYFDNGYRGTDAYVTMSTMAEHRCLGMRVAADPPAWDGVRRAVDNPGTIWDVYGPEGAAGTNWVRSIAAIGAGGGRWTFNQGGDPFPFEDVTRYSARRIRDRFPVELLLEYLTHFDIDLFNADFYRGPAIMLELTSPKYPETTEYATFEAARKA
jgi:hypothetical protein